MSFRTWLYVFAIGITLSGQAWSQTTTENEPRQEESTANANNNSEGQDNQPIDLTPALESIESAIRDLIAEEDKIEAENQERREQRDLNAQEGMAKWAELMFYATAATVLLTLAALFAIVRTLHHTKRAANFTEGMLDEAKATTEAAKATVESANNNARLQLRAYVGVQSVVVILSEDGDNIETDVKIFIANTGSTPATIPFFATTTGFTHSPEVQPSLGSTGHAQNGERVLGPNSKFFVSTGQSSKRIKDGPVGRYKIGVLIKYRDIYGVEYIESSWWHHRPFQTDKVVGKVEIALYPLKQIAGEQEGLTEKDWH